MKFFRTVLFFIYLFVCTPAYLIPVAHAQTGSWLWGAGNTGSEVDAFAIATDHLGNVYGAGCNLEDSTALFGTLSLPYSGSGGSYGGIQALWVKYNSSGTPLWLDGTQNGDAWLFGIATDAANDLIVFGSFDSPNLTIGGTTLTNVYGVSGGIQYYVAKYSPTGTLLWAKSDGSGVFAGQFIGGSALVLSTGSVTTDAAGNIYITSSFQEPSITIGPYTLTNADPSGNTFDVFVAKYSPTGTLLWATSLGGTSDDCAYGITVGAGGNIYITGPFWSPAVTLGSSVVSNPSGTGGMYAGNPIVYIAELSPAGAPIWGMAAGGPGAAYGMGLVSDPAGNVYMTGGFSDASITFGTTTINRTYPAAAPNLALFLVQLSPSNVVTWSKTIGSPTFGLWGFSIGLAACGEVWVSGNYSEDANIDGHTLAVVPGSDPVFIAGYTLSGSVIGYSGLGSGGDDENAIALDTAGNVYICSDYENVDPFSIGPTVLSASGGGIATSEYYYIGKYANVVGADTNSMQQDTTLCSSASSSIVLNAPTGYSGYTWNTASTSASITVSGSGTYWVICSSSCAIPTVVDTFHVNVTPAGTTSDDTNVVICSTAAGINLNGDPGYVSYTWNTGPVTPSVTVVDTGSYWVVEASSCGTRTDTFNVSLAPPIPVTATSQVEGCNTSIVFTAIPTGALYTYLWSGPDGFSNTLRDPFITNAVVADQGIYTVTVVNSATGCSGQATTSVTINPAAGETLTNITPTQTIPYGSSVQLNVDNAVYYWWMPNDGSLNNRNINNPIATPSQTTIYTVYGMDSVGCVDSQEIIVDVIYDSILIPSAFTPNNDGLNDVFIPLGMKYQSLVEFSVYNRWGQQIFTTNNKNTGWDGTYQGVKQDMDTYAYVLIVSLDDGNTHVFKGNVTLIR